MFSISRLTTASIAMIGIIAVTTITAFAANEITLSNPNFGGNGCPRGTFSATLDPDNSSLSLIFDKYIAEAGGSSGIRASNKTCNILIPINVARGYSIAIIRSDYRGFVNLPNGGNVNIKTDYFFHGYPGFHDEKSWDVANTNDYFFSKEISENRRTWSNCGKKVNLHVNTSLKVRTNVSNEEVYASLDTIDVASGGIIYKLLLKKCPNN
ncbi:MAG: DUF4360 domain-containing protein [Oligoflexia bacterium]|nr:DUF4360 domain-containing protein [Oligoflexia bacterium]